MNKLLQALAAVGDDSPMTAASTKVSPGSDSVSFKSAAGKPLPDGDAACDLMRLHGEEVTVPNVAAGDFDRVFRALGFTEVIPVINEGASGNRTFLVREGAAYYEAFQTNRRERGGFCYSVDFDISFEDHADYDRSRAR